jgi:hypothetical protein
MNPNLDIQWVLVSTAFGFPESKPGGEAKGRSRELAKRVKDYPPLER